MVTPVEVGQDRYDAVAERLKSGMLNAADGKFRDRVRLRPWWAMGSDPGEGLGRLLGLLEADRDASVWVGWHRSLHDDAQTALEDALGPALHVVDLNESSPAPWGTGGWRLWRCSTGTVIRLAEKVEYPAVLLPAYSLGWILYGDPDMDHVDLFVEPGAECWDDPD